MPNHEVRLKVDGMLYGGWTSITITRSMEQVAGSFELAVSERWAGQDVVRPIRPGMTCSVLVDGAPVITGHVDDVSVDYDARSHTVTVSGRDATGDMVDCSAPSIQFSGRTLPGVARELCAPYGIGVKVEASCAAEFQRLKNNEGDSVYETLEAAARVRAVLLLSDGLGNLVLSRVSSSRVPTPLVLGSNILSCSARFSGRDRYSIYTVKGQSSGSDDWYGESAAQPAGQARDKGVGRHRPLTVLAEEQIDPAAAAERAQWERNVRYGRGRTMTITVRGWSHAGGLWTPNRLVTVRDAFIGVDQTLLISGVTLSLSDQGELAELTVCPPEAFALLALPEPDEDEGLM